MLSPGSALEFPTPPLVHPIVALRPWRPSDVPDNVMIFGDEVIQRFSWSSPTPYAEDDARAYFVDQEQARLRGEEMQLALAEPGDDDTVWGCVSLYGISLEQGRASIGYWLGPRARGRGIASTAVRVLAQWGFTELGLARLELTCGPDNEASARVAERCGFTREGLLRSYMPFKGGRRDSLIFSLLPGELR